MLEDQAFLGLVSGSLAGFDASRSSVCVPETARQPGLTRLGGRFVEAKQPAPADENGSRLRLSRDAGGVISMLVQMPTSIGGG